MERQDAGDRYLGAPGPVDMDARENGVKADVSRRQHEPDEQLAKLIDHKKIQCPVVNIRPGRKPETAALAASVHARYKISFGKDTRFPIAERNGDRNRFT